jgi:hypothetical protein
MLQRTPAAARQAAAAATAAQAACKGKKNSFAEKPQLLVGTMFRTYT